MVGSGLFQMEFHLNRDNLTCINRNKTETSKNLPMNLFEDGSTVESGPVNYHVDRERSPVPKWRYKFHSNVNGE